MKPAKQGQAAMEFIATYGWAILIVIIVIGALSYSGAISPESILPEKCVLPAHFGCTDFRMLRTGGGGGDTIILKLQNKATRSMLIRLVNFSSGPISNPNGCYADYGATPVALKNTQLYTVSVGGCMFVDTGSSKNKVKVHIDYSWMDSRTITHSMDGELFARIEK